ncbi:nitroreductase family protein [Streptococcus merionis]|uniref:Nitroreductase family protein n=1 Tax=Streptococcus merionis TaxID=400065 RepID=A0A239SUB5_9STRE|nr:nitroreductase family protein [Streptococcus merionis]SNU89105.1 nitroreductase family protein [Streptococcus merionis]
MSDMIKLMKSHVSVRSFTDEVIPEEHLKEILEAGQAASSWKNFQSYSIIKVRSQETKQAIYDLESQHWIKTCDTFLLMVGDLNRAKVAVDLRNASFYPEGVENLLISSVDAALVGQNILLAAESLGYGGVMIGMVRQSSEGLAELLNLPEYTYPIFGIALGVPKKHNPIKPRLPLETVVFDEKYRVADSQVIHDFDAVQTAYAGARQTELWSERIVQQFGQPESPVTEHYLKKQKLLRSED